MYKNHQNSMILNEIHSFLQTRLDHAETLRISKTSRPCTKEVGDGQNESVPCYWIAIYQGQSSKPTVLCNRASVPKCFTLTFIGCISWKFLNKF